MEAYAQLIGRPVEVWYVQARERTCREGKHVVSLFADGSFKELFPTSFFTMSIYMGIVL